MNSEKVKEIKKVLECCKDRLCEVCPRLKQEPNQEEDCRLAVIEQSLTLINELESENEKLQQGYVVKAYDKLRANNKQFKDRIAELEKENEKLKQTNKNILMACNDFKNDHLKQFAERLIDKRLRYGERFNIYDIDETLKEFINE